METMSLKKFSRVSLGHFPTPLEPMDGLRRRLGGGPRLFIKRDDCSGLATGGNKTRKLEYLMGEAIAQKAQMVVTHGAVQSNHVRQTAAAAARYGLECVALLEQRVPDTGVEYEKNGNMLLNDLMGIRYEFRAAGGNMNEETEAWCRQISQSGKHSYFIPGGGSNEVGALGYVNCFYEMSDQIGALGENINWLVHATGSAGTQAGLIAGAAFLDSPMNIMGVSVRACAQDQKERVAGVAQKTLVRLGSDKKINAGEVLVDDRFVGPGYGQLDESVVAAIQLLAQTEGIFLDPVYSGKGFAGLLAQIREGKFHDSDSVIFLHTGGATALFAYRAVLSGFFLNPKEVVSCGTQS